MSALLTVQLAPIRDLLPEGRFARRLQRATEPITRPKDVGGGVGEKIRLKDGGQLTSSNFLAHRLRLATISR